ncbi:spore germination protein [Rossellomorea sp. GCM10028870]|uniref:spore germination protein n=1 Tax=Rossellomorea sp. GCM10028870 TaxID=3273426 RepID=UPI0036069512
MNSKIACVQKELENFLQKGELSKEQLIHFFQHHSDILLVDVGVDHLSVIYCRGMIDSAQYNQYIHTVIDELLNEKNVCQREEPPLNLITTAKDMIENVFSGTVIFYKDGDHSFWGLNIAKIPQRSPEESSTDIAIKGPKDAFTEEIDTNISLIRKRLKSVNLFSESFSLGSLSQTKVTLLYLSHKADKEMIDEIRKRLTSLDTESIVSAGQLEQWISDRTLSLFPLLDYITRPDFAIESMLRGRFVIVVNGSPIVLIGPSNLLELIKSPEDAHFPYHFVIFQRILRIIGIVTAIYLPGLWVAISSVNISQLPFSLLATVVISREGIPIPTALETVLILGLFELLREAGVRMPTAVGQTVSIVGGLIIGDAAIRAGLTSPTLIVIVALTAVCTYTLVNQSLSGTVSILRLYIIMMSAFLGVYGFFLATFSILIYLCKLESFKLAYLAPLTSINTKEILSALFQNPLKTKKFTWKELSKRRNS